MVDVNIQTGEIRNRPQTKKVETNFLKWENEGQHVEGYLEQVMYLELRNGSSPKYTVSTLRGERVAFLAPSQVAEVLSSVPMGKFVSITYTGDTRTSGGQKMKNFDIEVEVD